MKKMKWQEPKLIPMNKVANGTPWVPCGTGGSATEECWDGGIATWDCAFGGAG